MRQELAGGFFNLLVGRDPDEVAHEVGRFLRKHELDFLCFQEGEGYRNALRRSLADYDYYATTAYKGGTESGILVREDHRVTNVRYGFFGNGWTTVLGNHKAGPTFPRVTIDGWARVASVHLPTPTIWGSTGRLAAPPDRLDDYLAIAKRIRQFMTAGTNTRVVVGDWNEDAKTMGVWSPGWIAAQTKSTIVFPTSLAGRGRIDYAMVKNGRITRMEKDLEIRERSDHEPGFFTLKRY